MGEDGDPTIPFRASCKKSDFMRVTRGVTFLNPDGRRGEMAIFFYRWPEDDSDGCVTAVLESLVSRMLATPSRRDTGDAGEAA